MLTNTIYEDPNNDHWKPKIYKAADRELGRDWPAQAMTMIGLKRLRQLRVACEDVIFNDIPGDFVETGIWRGGACMMMAAVASEHGALRQTWGFDSFEGLPKATPGGGDPENDPHHTFSELSVSLEQVEKNFDKVGIDRVRVNLIKGWFKDTLPNSKVESISVLRLDGDMYDSTMIALESLYPKLSIQGYCIIDDFGAVEGCRKAVYEFREKCGITEPIVNIDGLGAYWRKWAKS